MRLAYADPPYLGCAHLYPEHPNASWYDKPEGHGLLMTMMERDYDGWALSLSSPSLPQILPLAPEGARIAAWVKPFAAFKRNVRCAYTWEPVIFKPGCDTSTEGAPVTRDHLSEPIALRKGLVGAKPVTFGRWVLNLLGYRDGLDTITDLFPGTGLMERVTSQMALVLGGGDAHEREQAIPERDERATAGVHVDAGRGERGSSAVNNCSGTKSSGRGVLPDATSPSPLPVSTQERVQEEEV